MPFEAILVIIMKDMSGTKEQAVALIDHSFGFGWPWACTERGRKQRHRMLWVATKPPVRKDIVHDN